MLEYKLRSQGKQLIKIDKWYPSSQLCHVCGYKNAVINIREEAKRSLAKVTSKDTVGRTGIYACGESVRRDSSSELRRCSR